ncbi:MAG: response regulator transcription factor [Spirochaetales bacterium]|nr:response regulator transcription factor [Spirochaetales bacterium]
MKRKVVVIDDHPIVRQGFVQLINMEDDLQVVGEAETASEALRIISTQKPDLALIDLSLKDSNGLELIKDVIHIIPELPILVVSLHDENIYAERALRAGAKGFIMKAEATDNVMTAIRQVLNGNIYLSNELKLKLVEKMTSGSGKGNISPVDVLSDRELEVFMFIGKGLKTRAIAESLNLSIKTIETYKSHLKLKLDLQDGTELIQRAVEWVLNEKC